MPGFRLRRRTTGGKQRRQHGQAHEQMRFMRFMARGSGASSEKKRARLYGSPPAQIDPTLLAEAEEEDAPERRTAVVSRELHGVRLDKALVTMADEFSRNHLQGLIEHGMCGW